jgi:hypothetical protein
VTLTKLARIEDRLREVIEEVTLYRAPSGELYGTIEEAVTSIIAAACPRGHTPECQAYRASGGWCHDCRIGTFLRDEVCGE